MKAITAALVAAIIGISVVVPFVTQAQTTASSNTSLIALLTQLVQLLEQELQQLIAAQANMTPLHPTNPNNSANFTVSPTSGAAPLTVVFNGSLSTTLFSLDFGNGTSQGGVTGGPVQQSVVLNTTHTYNYPGTYTARLTIQNPCLDNCYADPRTTIGTATIIVTGSGTPQ